MSVNDLLDEVLQLPPASRATLVEKIVESIAADIDPAVGRAHLNEIKLRREQAAADPNLISQGDEVLARARAILQK